MIKKIINKENIKAFAKEGAKLGVEVVSESTKSFINGLFYKIVFVVLLIGVIAICGCVGTDLILDAIKKLDKKDYVMDFFEILEESSQNGLLSFGNDSDEIVE